MADSDVPNPKRRKDEGNISIASPLSSKQLRGVQLPDGWIAQGSLLVWSYGDPEPSPMIAGFDFDGCLAHTSLHDNSPNAWKMQFEHIPAVLKKLHSTGHKIVVVTNESMDRLKKHDAINNCIVKKTTRLMAFAHAVNVPMQDSLGFPIPP